MVDFGEGLLSCQPFVTRPSCTYKNVGREKEGPITRVAARYSHQFLICRRFASLKENSKKTIAVMIKSTAKKVEMSFSKQLLDQKSDIQPVGKN